MSKKLIDKLIQEAYGTVVKRHVNKLARQRVDNAGLHLIYVTPSDIYDLLVYNYVAIKRPKLISAARMQLRKEGAEDQSRAAAAKQVIESDNKLAADLRKEAKDVADIIFNNLVKEYNTKVQDPAYHAVLQGGKIEILQPRNQAHILKDCIINLLKQNSVNSVLNNLTYGKALTSMTRRTQFLHLGKTVGVQILEDLKQAAFGTGNSAAKKAAIIVLEKMLSNISFEWQSDDSITSRNIQVVGRIGQTLANKPGQESTDWKVLRPLLENELYKELDKQGSSFATKQGSQPFDERMVKTALNNVLLDPLKKNKRIKTTSFKVDKPKNHRKSSNIKKQSNTIAGGLAAAKRRKITEAKAQAQKGVSSSPLQLIGILNSRLPSVVAKNMGSPALNNVTGRFAGSVRVTDVRTTAQGFPSFGYTYRRNPYETFEVGNKQGSIDKDPRRLIEGSIREIATQYAIGRFYTRRV